MTFQKGAAPTWCTPYSFHTSTSHRAFYLAKYFRFVFRFAVIRLFLLRGVTRIKYYYYLFKTFCEIINVQNRRESCRILRHVHTHTHTCVCVTLNIKYFHLHHMYRLFYTRSGQHVCSGQTSGGAIAEGRFMFNPRKIITISGIRLVFFV